MSRYPFFNSSEGIEDSKQRSSIVGAGLFSVEAVTLVEAYSPGRVTPQRTPVVTSIGWGQSQPKVALGFCCKDIFGHCGFTMNELIGMLG